MEGKALEEEKNQEGLFIIYKDTFCIYKDTFCIFIDTKKRYIV